MWITKDCRKFFKRWEYQTPYSSPEKPVCRSRSNRIRREAMDWFKSGKGVHQGCVFSLCLFNLYAEYIIQNARLDKLTWNEDCWEKYQQPQICRWHHPNGRKQSGTKTLLIRMKEEGEKAGLKLSIKRTKTMEASQAALVVENLPASEGKHKSCSFGGEGDERGWDGWMASLTQHEFEQAPGDGEGRGSLACCSPWGHRLRHNWTTEQRQFLPGGSHGQRSLAGYSP